AETAAKRAEDIASAVALEDASTTKKGIVQLSSATNSTSEKLAATPKAVKTVKDSSVQKTGDTMGGQLKISTINALRIFNQAFGLIFRRSEDHLHLIPTNEGEGENGDIGSLRPFSINLRSGLVSIGNGLKVGGSVTGNLTGNADTATKIKTARKIGGVAFDGSADINLPGVNATGNQNTTGNAATATKLQTARSIGGVVFDGSANINLPGVNTTGNQNTTGNAATATKLQTARTIGGVSFDGTANINLPGVNTTGNQNTTGNAATATKLQTARTINGVSFDGSKNIELTPRSIGTINSATMSFSGGAGWFKLATVTMPQASSVVYISLIGGAGYNVGSPHQAGISELVLRAGNGNPKGITGALWRRTSVGFTNFAWVNTSGDTYDVYVEIGNYATGVNIQWDYTSNASVTIHTSPTYTANKPTGLTDGTVYVIYSSHIKPTATDVGALPITGGNLNGGLTATGEIISKSANGLRIAYGSYGFFIRNDGSNTYFMLTNSGNSLGTYNSLRPLIINNANGAVTIANGLNVTGGVNGSLNGNASTATKLQTARNINGVKFDGSGDININTLVSRGRVTALSGSTQGTAGIQMYEAYNNGYPTAYGNILHMKGAGAIGEGEMLVGWSGTDGAHAPVYVRSRRDTSTANWSGWAQVYTTAHKPTAADVGALPISGGTMTGVLTLQNVSQPLKTQGGGILANDGNLYINKSGFAGWIDALFMKNSGGTMSGQLKIRSTDGLRIYDAAYGMIFRRSENNFYLIPTAKDQGENGGIGSLRPFYVDLTNGRVTMGNGAVVNGGLGLGVVNGLGGNSIVLGDNDTGFKQNGDGILDVYANSAHVFRFVNSTLQSLKPLSVTGDITSSAWVYANRFSINSGSGAWIDMRNQNVIFGRNAVSTSSAQALLRQDHADRKFFLGGLGNSQFGFYMINNSRTENGTDANAYLQNDGTWVCGGNGSFNDVYIRSDRRSKRNIRKIERALDKLDRIEGVLYEIQVCGRYEQSGGLIAQDVQNVQPELVTVDHNDQSGEPRLRLNYNGVIGMLVEAVKELREEVRELKAKM
ncbi:tail fiber protein, partial [Escherichia coli]